MLCCMIKRICLKFKLLQTKKALKNMVEAGNPEKWKRAEWRRTQGKEVQNKDLWELYLEKSGKFDHKIEFAWSKAHEYTGILQEMMKGEREDVG